MLTGVQASVRSPRPLDAAVGEQSASWASLNVGAPLTGLGSTRVATYGSLACGLPFTIDVAIRSDQGETTVPVTITPTGRPGPRERTWRPDWMPKTIAANKYSNHTFHVATEGVIRDVELRIGRLTHARVGGLRLALRPPGDGVVSPVVLADRRGGDGDDFVDTVFDDDAAQPIRAGRAPFTGRFRPEEPLSRLNGRPAAGFWELYVENLTDEEGVLDAASVDVIGTPCQDARNARPLAVPAPPNYDDPAVHGVPYTLDASRSWDADGRIVAYRWDFESDGVIDRVTTTPHTEYTWSSGNTVTYAVTVVDDRRATHREWGTVSLAATPRPRPQHEPEPTPVFEQSPEPEQVEPVAIPTLTPSFPGIWAFLLPRAVPAPAQLGFSMAASHKLRGLRTGLKLVAGCSVACTLEASLTDRGRRIGRVRLMLAGGRPHALRLPLTAATRRALTRRPRTRLVLSLKATAVSGAGPPATAKRAITIRR